MKNIVVIDLNVFVRALLTSGVDKKIYEAIKQGRITPVFCPDMLDNLARVLIRSHLKIDLEDTKELLSALRLKSLLITPGSKINACRDASDNIILEAAVASNAKAIVTNDPDLLVLSPFRGISILDSRSFLKTLNRL